MIWAITGDTGTLDGSSCGSCGCCGDSRRWFSALGPRAPGCELVAFTAGSAITEGTCRHGAKGKLLGAAPKAGGLLCS